MLMQWKRFSVERFIYLRSAVQKNGSFNDMNHRIKMDDMSGILSDKRFSILLRGKFYKEVMRPAMVWNIILGCRQEDKTENQCGGENVKVDEYSNSS